MTALEETARDVEHERYLTALAAEAAGVPHFAESISDYADARSWDGTIRARSIQQWRTDLIEELADARAYVVMTLTVTRPYFEAGSSWACDLYVQFMGCLVGVLAAWAAIHTTPS